MASALSARMAITMSIGVTPWSSGPLKPASASSSWFISVPIKTTASWMAGRPFNSRVTRIRKAES